MIQLEVNGDQRNFEGGSVTELLQAIRNASPRGEVVCVPDLAHQSLEETGDWIGHIGGVPESIAEDGLPRSLDRFREILQEISA